jgi:hypothetical protein
VHQQWTGDGQGEDSRRTSAPDQRVGEAWH